LRTIVTRTFPERWWRRLRGKSYLSSSGAPSHASLRERALQQVAFFGNFDPSNFGNESTLRAMLHNFHQLQPDARAICITTSPAAIAATYGIRAIGIERTLLHAWAPRDRLVQRLRRIFNGVLSEPYQWIRAGSTLRGVDMLVIPGTGLLTDAYGLRGWGPYGLFRWSVVAKIYGCKLIFLSVGAGPLNTAAGRCLSRIILSLADYRSYRDYSTKQYLKNIGVDVSADLVCPDPAFSLPKVVPPRSQARPKPRKIVGLGVMHYTGRFAATGDTVHANYLHSLVQFASWLIEQGYDVRLLSGDVGDGQTREELRRLLQLASPSCESGRIIDKPIRSVSDLLSQISATDIVVATRFHNAVLSLLSEKPTISISFHHKCASLMNTMDMSKYCLDIDALSGEALIEAFSDLEANETEIIPIIGRKTQQFREEMDRQYRVIFGEKA
jgi:polysaccharide pyruvyl transferase WcaK-like protein